MLYAVAPDLHAWDTQDFKAFRSFAVAEHGEVVLIDPVAPDADEAAAIEALGRVVAILLTSAWHERDAEATARRFAAPIYAHPEAIGAIACKAVEPLPEPLPLGLRAWRVPGGFDGQVAYYMPRDGGTLITGDCWMNIAMHEKPLPVRLLLKYLTPLRDGLHLMPPRAATDSAAIIAAYREHLTHPVERLLVSHGTPILTGAREQMLARLDQGP